MVQEFLILGIIILVGFIGHAIFKYTKVPESLFMIIIGLVVGPFTRLVEPTQFVAYTPLIIALTLIIVLLDSGLTLSIMDISRTLGKAIAFTITVLVLSTFIIGTFMYLLGWELLHALLIGVVSSGTTTIVVTSLIYRLSITEEIKQILCLESIINDVTLVTAAVLIIQLMQIGTLNLNQIVVALVQPISVSLLLGILFALIWVNVVWLFYEGDELLYCFTLGVLFLLYFFVGVLDGNGAIAVLVLSLSLGNIPYICEKVGKSRLFKTYPRSLQTMATRSIEVVNGIKRTQVDFAFFIKNFFFVYLGIIFDLTKLNPFSMGICAVIIVLMFVSRYLSTRIIGLVDANFKKYSTIISSMLARGFTATFVALLPTTMGVEIPHLKEIILLIVLFSLFPTILGTIIFERKNSNHPC